MARLPVRSIAVTAALSAVVLVLGFTRTGFVPWGAGASITFMHVPVILAAVLEGPVAGLIVGAVFGLQSLLQAAISPTTPLDPVFTNPLISILPRLFIGPVSALVFSLLRGRGKNVVLQLFGAFYAAIAGTLTNTTLVLTAFFLFAKEAVAAFMPNFAAVGTLVVANGVPEAIVAVIFVLAIFASWKGIAFGIARSKLSYDDDPAPQGSARGDMKEDGEGSD